MYDRVAGDDVDTGDEIDDPECYVKDHSKPFKTIYSPSPTNLSVEGSKHNIRDDTWSNDTRNGNSHNSPRPESPIPFPRSTKISSQSLVDGDEEKVVMRVTPKPPARRRPKSTPVFDHVSNQLSQMMEEKMR